MKYRFLLVGALGVALAVYLVRFVGFSAVLSAATAVGWRGFVLLCLYLIATFPLLGLVAAVRGLDLAREALLLHLGEQRPERAGRFSA